MKHIVLLLIGLISVQNFGQRIVNKDVGEFHTVKVFDLIEVNLIQSDENRILIKGENVDDIKWVNKDGILKLRMQLDKKFTGEDTLIEVYYQNLDLIDANEGAKITCNEMLKQEKITLKAQEGARILIGMDVTNVNIRAVTGGIISASGLTENQSVVINTGGIFEGSDLHSSNTEIKISAGGEAEVYASERVDVNVRAGGEVLVYGNPDYVKKNTFVGGNIIIVE